MPAWLLWTAFGIGAFLAAFLAYDKVRRERDAALCVPWLEDIDRKFAALLAERPHTETEWEDWRRRATGPRHALEDQTHSALSGAQYRRLIDRKGIVHNPPDGMTEVDDQGWWYHIYDRHLRVQELLAASRSK